MNSRQIAEATGKGERTIRRWANAISDKMSGIKDKMSGSTSGHPADFDLEETVAIIKHGMGANAADLYRASASHPSTSIRFPAEEFQAIVESAVRGALAAIRAEAKASGSAPAIAQIEAPKMTDRSTLNKLVREYATAIGGDFKAAWGALYNAALYRLHTNLPARAEHSGRSAIDIAEEEGLLPELVAIAREVLK